MGSQLCQGLLLRQAWQILRFECVSIPPYILSIWSDSFYFSNMHVNCRGSIVLNDVDRHVILQKSVDKMYLFGIWFTLDCEVTQKINKLCSSATIVW